MRRGGECADVAMPDCFPPACLGIPSYSFIVIDYGRLAVGGGEGEGGERNGEREVDMHR